MKQTFIALLGVSLFAAMVVVAAEKTAEQSPLDIFIAGTLRDYEKAVSDADALYKKRTDPDIGQPQTSNGSTRIEVAWKTLLPGQTGVQPNQTVHYGVSIQGGNNNPGWQLLTPEWTKTVPGGMTKRKPAHPTGFTVEQTSSVLYTIYNNTVAQLDITNLQFMISPTEIPLSQMVPGYKLFSLYGFGPMEPTFLLPVGGSMPFYLPMGDTGEFLLAKGVSQVPGMPDTMSEWVQQCEVQFVPEPATLSLLALGGLSLLRRRRK